MPSLSSTRRSLPQAQSGDVPCPAGAADKAERYCVIVCIVPSKSPPTAMANPLNKYSARITQRNSQVASQAMLYGTGLTDEDMNKAQVGIVSMWYEGNTCNMHLLDLAAEVKKGVQAVDLVGFRFNTIGVSDGISMGTEGMNYSLQSREIIADSIETVMSAQWYDACVAIPGCDKNMPGSLIGMGRR